MVTKLHGGGQGVFVNSVFAGGKTATTNFTLYVNPYLVAQNGGRYTKHIYIGSQRIVSKLGDFESYGADPRRIEKAGEAGSGPEIDYEKKYKESLQTVKDNYAELEVVYQGLDNNDYVNGLGFCCNLNASSSSTSKETAKSAVNDNAELQQFYYHPDHLGSSSYISNLDGEVVQHLEYTPFGEIFIEEKNSKWNTPYLFTSKELDRETGMYYFGARYYTPRESMWLSVDKPLLDGTYLNFEHDGGVLNSFNLASYAYCRLNPVTMFDPNGNQYNHSVLLTPQERPLSAYGREYENHQVLTGYQFTSGTTHLLSLVSGVNESNIENATVNFSVLGIAGASITLGSSPQSANITHYYDNKERNDATNGASFYSFLKRNAHEVGHIPQLENGTTGQIVSSVAEYIQNIISGQDWHEGKYATKEKAANVGGDVFTNFYEFIDKNYSKDGLKNLFENKSNSQENIIDRIDQ